MDEHLAQIRIPPLTDSQQLRLPSGRPLPGYQTQPGGKLPPLFEGGAVADGRYDSRGHQGADSGDSLQANAGVMAAGDLLEILPQALDLQLPMFPLLPKEIQQAAHAGRQLLIRVLQNLRY